MNIKIFITFLSLISLCTLNAEDCIKASFCDKTLKGLVFVSPKEHEELPSEWNRHEVLALSSSIPHPSRFKKAVSPFIGRCLNVQLLGEIQHFVTEYFADHGYPIVAVIPPAEQDISHGVVRFVIIVGCLGKVETEGACYFSKTKVKKGMKMRPGEAIQEERILADLDWINQSPFRQTRLIYRPGEGLGQTDILLQTEDRVPFRPLTGYENTGNLVASNARYFVGFTAGNLFKGDSRLNYLFVSSPHTKDWWAQTASFVLPIHHLQNTLEIYGGYVHSRPNKGEDVDLRGKEWEIAARYNIPFFTGKVRNNLFIGYEFIRTNNFLSFAKDLIFDNFFDISQFLVGYGLNYQSPKGSTSFGITLYGSPGGMTKYNHSRYFKKERPGTSATYLYATLTLEQLFWLKKQASWVAIVEGQYSGKKLLPSEEFSLGGFYTVRGYDENEVISNNGFLLKNELRSPTFTSKSNSAKNWLTHQIQFLAFIDFGLGFNVDRSIVDRKNALLASIGPGIRYNFRENATIRFDYGWQLKFIDRTEDDSKKHARAHFAATLSF